MPESCGDFDTLEVGRTPGPEAFEMHENPTETALI